MSRGPTWGPCTVHAGPTYYLGGTYVKFRRDPHGTHALFRQGPCGTHALFRRDPGSHVGPMCYSDGTHVGPTVLLSEPFILKKLFSFHYLTIQNIFNYFLHIKIITKFCILHSHVVVLLLFGFGFPSINSQNILELFIHF